MTLRYLSGYNGYLPRETGLVIGFIRKPSEFALNAYVQYIEAPTPNGAYDQLSYDDSIRIIDDRMYAWEDGDPAPRGEAEKHRFQKLPFRTRRRAYPWTLGYISINTATWKPKLVHMDDAISKAMTARTKRVSDLLDTASGWGANTAAANALNGGAGNFKNSSDDPTSPNYLAIFKTIQEAGRRVHLATNGKVKTRDLVIVVGPDMAIAMAQSAEMTNYVRESPFAREVMEEGLGRNQFELWGLPPRYKGYALVVEDAPIVTEVPKASGVEATIDIGRRYIKQPGTMWVLSRPGGLDGEYGTKSFSTMQIYHYGALLETEAFDSPKDRCVEGRCSENLIEVLGAAPAGFLVTGGM